MPRASGFQATNNGRPLGTSNLPNVNIESQIADDRNQVSSLQEPENINLSSIRQEELHNDSLHASSSEVAQEREKSKSKSGEIASDGSELAQRTEENDKPVSWSALPRKDQLLLLTLARLAEPVVQTSLGAYMFFMLKSFDESLPDSKISSQAGMLAASFTFAQCLTAVFWGRLADKEWMGRKNVLLIGLVGTLLSCIGFGFSKSFLSAAFFRGFGGALNGNVGVMRTMISEIVEEKKYLPKAFLVMPVTFNVGVLIGPLLGGYLQDPVHTFPRIFGPHSILGGNHGVGWMSTFPYALPNLVSSMFLFGSVVLVVLGLEETHVDKRHRKDIGRRLGEAIGRGARRMFCCSHEYEYSRLRDDEEDVHELEACQVVKSSPKTHLHTRAKLPYRRIFTRNVICTFMVHAMLAAHLSAFHNMLFLFFSTPRYDPKHFKAMGHSGQRLPFNFSGGLGMPPPTIGFALSIIGAIGLTMQFGVYSKVTHRLGIIKAYRSALILFPVAYALLPYLAILPTKSKPPDTADGIGLWLVIACLLLIIVTGRTFSLPITQILVNNCSPHPSVLSSVHGLGQSVSAGARTLGPIVWSTLYGVGLHQGVVGLGFWTLCIESLLCFGASWLVYEGNGHEIRLEGDP